MSKTKMMTMDEMLMEENFEIIEGITETGKKYKIETNKNKQGVDYYGVSTNIEIYGVEEEPTGEEIDSLLNELGYEEVYCSDTCTMEIGGEDVSLPDKTYKSDLSNEFISYVCYSYFCESDKTFEIRLRGGLPKAGDDMYWENIALESIYDGLEKLLTDESKELEKLEVKWNDTVVWRVEALSKEEELINSKIKDLLEEFSFKNADLNDIVSVYYENDYEDLIEIAEDLVYQMAHCGANPIDENESIIAIENYIENQLSDDIY